MHHFIHGTTLGNVAFSPYVPSSFTRTAHHMRGCIINILLHMPTWSEKWKGLLCSLHDGLSTRLNLVVQLCRFFSHGEVTRIVMHEQVGKIGTNMLLVPCNGAIEVGSHLGMCPYLCMHSIRVYTLNFGSPTCIKGTGGR